MFFSFRKKKKFNLTEEQIKWNQLWDKYANGVLDENYYVLCDYHAGVNGGGHHCFLDNNAQSLLKYVKSLKILLPNNFFAEFNKAYTAYIDNNDVEKMCDLADNYFYENEQVIFDILQAYANSFQ